MTLDDKYKTLMERIGYTFKKPELLIQAFSHSSYVNERKINPISCYERLEFLGDAVLELVVSEYLYSHEQGKKEGELSKLRSTLVCEQSLAQCARELDYPQYVLLSKGLILQGGANRDSLLCDLFEAVLGAIYLDGGMEPAKQYVESFLLKDIAHKQLFYDAKSNLQILGHKLHIQNIEYVAVKEEGPDHNKTFEYKVLIDGKEYGYGVGTSIKNAEQKAAYETIIMLQGQVNK